MKETKGIAPVVIAVVIIVAIIAAAGVWYVTQPEEEKPPVVEPEDGPFSREQTFVWGEFAFKLTSLNPITNWRVTLGTYEVAPVYEPLATINLTTLEFVPRLAEEWSWVDDYTFEIKIQPEAYFRKGQPVTAEDVKFSLETLADPISGIIASELFEPVESVEVRDEKTLWLHIKGDQPPQNPRVFLLLATNTCIFEKDEWSALLEEYGEDIAEYTNMDPEKVNGSGPYTLLSSTPESAIFVRVDNYWGNQLGWYNSPKYYQCIYTASDAINLTALELGALDMADATGFTKEWIEARKHPDGWLWGLNPAGDWDIWKDFEMCQFMVVPNPDREIFRHTWMRYAIAYAIDYLKTDEVGAAGGIATRSGPYFLPLPNLFPWLECYNTEIVEQCFETETVLGVPVIKYDPDKAVEILEANCEGSVTEGWTYNGEPIGPFEVLSSPAGGVMALSEVIAKNLSDIGIEATVYAPDWGLYWDLTLTGVFDFDVRWALNGFRAPPDPVAQLYTEAFLIPGDCWMNSKFDYWKYWNGDYLPLLENTAGQVEELIDSLWPLEPGSDDYCAVVRQIQEIFIPQLPFIPLSQPMSPTVVSTKYWANLPYGDDPLDWLTKTYNWFHGTLMHVYPKWVETLDATLSSNTVDAGEPVTVEVTLKNTGTVTQLYPVKVHEGPAAPGEYITEPEKLIAHKAVRVGAGQTRTVELEVTIDTPGTYTLTVDCWRYSEWDPGEPRELTLTVT